MISVGSDRQEKEGEAEKNGYAALADRVLEDGDRYFARGRLRWLRRCLDQLGERPAAVLDFGCSDGNTSATSA